MQPQQKNENKNMTTLHLRNSVSRAPSRRGGLLLISLAIALASFALSPTAQAVSPAPDGGYAGENTAEGTDALFRLTTGIGNTANGDHALFINTTGSDNTANGDHALFINTTGSDNTANGFHALLRNTTGFSNTANGGSALYHNSIGSDNTATGLNALFSNMNGSDNTANGENALFNNTRGGANTANGFEALFSNTGGDGNTASGVEALFSNTGGSTNTANGGSALFSNTTGSSNIALGFAAGDNLTTGSNNIDIGNFGIAAEANTIRIGTVGTHTAAFIAGIHGVTVASAVGVIVDANGHLGTVTSSARFKEAIKPMDKASEAILSLRPVTFRYKHELDPDGIPQFGLVAEQVEKVNPDLVVRDAAGQVNTVRYEAVNAMLLNEFLKEHRKVEQQDRREQELEATIAQQQKDFQSTIAQQRRDFESTVAQQQKQIEALAARIQKVNDQMELSRPAPQVVANNQ
jgi:hypothetical protein